ncbi:MAG: T9SS type A sorting domain-containing protein, partial [candidate division WOR-3 bacterium]
DSLRSYADMAPGESHTAAPFGLTIAPGCTSGHIIPFLVMVTSQQGTWQSGFELMVRGPTMRVTGWTVHDANGRLDPDEETEISVTVSNSGDSTASAMNGVLRSLNPFAIAVLDSLGSFGDIGPGETLANILDRFRVRVAPGIGAGRRFSLRLVMRGTDGYEFVHDFPVTIGAPGTSAPLGPDHYGYYAYDNTDVGYPERPDFSWVEIDPSQGGSGTMVQIGNDRAVPVDLPFTFWFYGQSYNTISVCDNGYVALGSTWLGDPYNWRIPSANGPDGIIAPFWDDFRCDTLGAHGVFYYHDAPNHRFIVEWSSCRHVHGFRTPEIAEPQTFELIIYDPSFHPTRTGDGPILFQYLVVQNDDSQPGDAHNFATVGIQNPDHSDGLEYTFAGRYPVAAAPLDNGRAIRFTTNPPDTFTPLADSPQLSANSLRFTAWPNPARQIVHLALGLPGHLRTPATRVRIFDVQGREVASATITGTKGTWDLKDRRGRRVPAGVYQMALTPSHGKDMIFTRIIVLK